MASRRRRRGIADGRYARAVLQRPQRQLLQRHRRGDTDGYVWFTNGHNPWHDEYFWLDGEIYLQTQEDPGAYNVGAVPVSKSLRHTKKLGFGCQTLA